MAYVVRRLLAAIPVLVAVSIVVFAGIRLIPGDQCFVILRTPEYTQEQCDKVRNTLGLDKPAPVQYVDWATGVMQGDFGTSFITNRSALDQIQDRLPATIELALLSSVFALLVGIPFGVAAAFNQNKPIDYATRFISIGWLSLPNFWVATLLIVFPSQLFGYSAPVGYTHFWEDPFRNLEQMLFPVISLGIAISATLARLTRSSMLEVLREDYIRTARAKGLNRNTVLSRHALKNAMLPVITLFGLQFGTLLGGTVILETIYGLPGLGTLLLSSVQLRDYVQIQAIALLFALIVIFISLIVDLSYGWFDPRVKY
jgi:peptide/nickel transport system permease protein